jgi:hypothetical protein
MEECRERRALLRIVRVLELVWTKFAVQAVSIRFDTIFRRAGILFGQTTRDTRYAFAGDFTFEALDRTLFATEEDMLMIANLNKSDEVIAYFRQLIIELLKRECIYLSPKKIFYLT